jgi:predicted Zn finger-like uncharacterized protein
MRYIVSEGAVGLKGRTVRCAHCGHQWFQEGEEGLDEALFADDLPSTGQYEDSFKQPEPADEDDIDFQSILQKEIESAPIPEGVRPVHEGDDPVLAQLGPRKEPKLPSGAKLSGFMTAALIWIFIVAGLLFAQPMISRAFPPSNMVYSLLGMRPSMPGEGMALDGLHAEIADGKIMMKGVIINLRETDMKVPAVMASIVDHNEKVIDQLLIPPPIARIKAEGQASFEAFYPKIPDGATNVTFAFSFIKAKPQAPAVPETPAPEKVGETQHDEEPPAAAK